jgi:hypothetical protein
MIPPARVLAGVHAAYLLASGVWPLVHRRSFERVVGPKEDFWLVRTVGGLAVATGASLGLAALRGRRRPETVILALGSGAVFGAADVRAARTESRLYLGDTVLQLAFAPAWLADWKARAPRLPETHEG